MRHLVWDASFRRAFRRRTGRNATLRKQVLVVLEKLAQDPFTAELKTHKLKGELAGLWACWVERDCRIIFVFEPEQDGGEDMIVLVDIGSHDEVY